MKTYKLADVPSFRARATPFLLAHEAHNNLLLGLASELTASPHTYGAEPPQLYIAEDGGEVVLVALQTPPHRLVLAHTARLEALDLLAATLIAEGRSLPGCVGPRPVAEGFAQAWAARSGCQVTTGMEQRIYQLTRVRWPAPVAGRMRRAAESDRPLLEDWLGAFNREAMAVPGSSDLRQVVTRWLTSEQRHLALWEDGEPVALAGAAGPTPNGIRIGAVYTPPQRRRRGYASALVAALSQAQLAAGRRFCFLYTDLSNPISNHIYQTIGYEPVVDSVELHFT